MYHFGLFLISLSLLTYFLESEVSFSQRTPSEIMVLVNVHFPMFIIFSYLSLFVPWKICKKSYEVNLPSCWLLLKFTMPLIFIDLSIQVHCKGFLLWENCTVVKSCYFVISSSLKWEKISDVSVVLPWTSIHRQNSLLFCLAKLEIPWEISKKTKFHIKENKTETRENNRWEKNLTK